MGAMCPEGTVAFGDITAVFDQYKALTSHRKQSCAQLAITKIATQLIKIK